MYQKFHISMNLRANFSIIMIVADYPFPSHLSFDVKYIHLRSFIKNKKKKKRKIGEYIFQRRRKKSKLFRRENLHLIITN